MQSSPKDYDWAMEREESVSVMTTLAPASRGYIASYNLSEANRDMEITDN